MGQPLFRVTGAVHHWVRFNTNQGPYYLGTCETNPEVEVDRAIVPVYNDISGDQKPFVRLYLGQDALILSRLNRYDEVVYAQAADVPRHAKEQAGARSRGTDDRLARGAFAFGFELWLRFDFAGTNQAQADDPIGYYFASVLPEKDKLEPLGTRVRDVFLFLSANGAYNPQDGSFFCYSTDPKYFQNIPATINPQG